MKKILVLLLLVSCAQVKTQKQSDEVSVAVALDQAQMSYLKGCVDAMKEIKIPITFIGCRDKAILHRQELDSIMNQDL